MCPAPVFLVRQWPGPFVVRDAHASGSEHGADDQFADGWISIVEVVVVVGGFPPCRRRSIDDELICDGSAPKPSWLVNRALRIAPHFDDKDQREDGDDCQ